MSEIKVEVLQEEISKRNIYLPDKKMTAADLTKALGNYYVANNRSEMTWGKLYYQSLYSVMLIEHLKHFQDKYTDEYQPLTSKDWISELKINDFRVFLVYSPETGFELFSRRITKKNFMKGVFTDKVLFIKNGLVRTSEDFKNAFNYRFVLDCGVMIDTDDLTFDGTSYQDTEDFLQAVLGSLSTRSKEFQLSGKTLVFRGFDVLYFEKDPKPYTEVLPEFKWMKESVTEEEAAWVEANFSDYLRTSCLVTDPTKKGKKVWEKDPGKKIYGYLYMLKDALPNDIRKLSFGKRRQIRDSIINFLQKNNLPFEHILTENTDKIGFAEEMIRASEEGVIIKNLHAPYFATENRSHRAMYKIKTSVSQMLANDGIESDFDCFITGVEQAKSKANKAKGLFGSLNVSVYLREDDGTTKEHLVGRVAGVCDEDKLQMSYIDSEGKVQLKEDYIGKVVAVNGMSMSCRSLRFNHCVLYKKDLNQKNIMFKDKDPINCIYDRSSLAAKILTRGQ